MSSRSTLFDVANLAVDASRSSQIAVLRQQMQGLHRQAKIEALRRKIVEMTRNMEKTQGPTRDHTSKNLAEREVLVRRVLAEAKRFTLPPQLQESMD